MRFLTYLVLFLLKVIVGVNCSKILVVFGFPAHSHFTLGFKLAEGLAKKGHEVHFVSPFPQKNPIKNLVDISVADIIPKFNSMKDNLFNMGEMTYLGQLEFLRQASITYHETFLNHPNIKNLLNSNEKFDAVVLEHFISDGLSIIPYKLNTPFILVAPGPNTIFNNYLFANPAPPSYIPNLLSTFGSKMNIFERLINLYYDVVGKLFYRYYTIPTQNEILQKALPGSPHVQDLIYRVDFMLTVSHPSINEPVPLQQNIKQIGGHHVSDPKPLPEDLKTFLDNANEGVVVFSMGSNLQSSDFSEEKKKAVLKAFSKIKHGVLWKFEKDLPEKPKNVKIVPWLPQNDILAHPNVVAFISHGGLLGNIEAVHHGVPILGLSVFWDQQPNMEAAKRKGYAVHLRYSDLNEESFWEALSEILYNPRYLQNARKQKAILQDRILKPLDEAIYWIEYVIRHNGAEHLRSAGLNYNWIQTHSIDVVIIVFISILIIVKSVLALFKNISSSTNTKENINKKKKVK